jgi:ABC-type sugar transport system, permease component
MATDVSVKKLRFYWPVYLLAVLPVLLVLIFCYQPIVNGLVHMFYRWDGDAVEEFIGLDYITKVFSDIELVNSFGIVTVFVVCNLVKMILPIVTAVILHHVIDDRLGYLYRVLFVVPMIIPSMVGILIWKYFYEPNSGILNGLLRAAGFIEPAGTVQWLSDPYLVIPSLVFMGFPWVGAFGVLIYLAGLQGISEDIYEAADLDGAGPLTVFFRIELPLIMTQVRINLVLMIIGTIQSWQNIYLFLGIDGGPDGIATVPGLLIFREAFSRGLFGYGCAIGFVIFAVTLALTLINNKLVRINK